MDAEDVEFYCFHCKTATFYNQGEVDRMVEMFRVSGALWWSCPVCGIKDYFEDVWKRDSNDM